MIVNPQQLNQSATVVVGYHGSVIAWKFLGAWLHRSALDLGGFTLRLAVRIHRCGTGAWQCWYDVCDGGGGVRAPGVSDRRCLSAFCGAVGVILRRG